MKAISPEAWEAMASPTFSNVKFRSLITAMRNAATEQSARIMEAISPEVWEVVSQPDFDDDKFGWLIDAVTYVRRSDEGPQELFLRSVRSADVMRAIPLEAWKAAASPNFCND